MSFTTPLATVGAAGTGPVTTASIDTTGADLLIAVGTQYSGVAAASVSDSKGNTWNGLTVWGGSISYVQIWWCKPTTVGTGHTFTLDNTGSFYGGLEIQAWAGSTASPFDVQNGANGTSGTSLATGSVTPSQNGSLIVAAFCPTDGTSGSATIDSGFTVSTQHPFSTGVNEGSAAAYFVQSTAAAINPTWTVGGGSGELAAAIAVFKPSASGGATDNPRNFQDGLPAAYYSDPGYAAIYVPYQQGITVAVRSEGPTVNAAAGSITVANTTTGVGAATQKADASDTNTSTLTGVGAASAKADASSTAQLTLTGVGLATVSGSGSITAANTTTGVGASTNSAAASDTNTATVTGVGAATQGAAASDTNTATLTGVGAATQKADAGATGVLTLTGEGASVAAGSANGTIAMTSGLTGVGAASAKAAGFTLRTTDATLVLGLNLDGNFTDVSAYGHVLTNNGVTTSSAQFKAGTESGLFTTTGTEIHAAATAEWAFSTATGTTWQAWVYPTTVDATRRSLWDWRFDGTGSGTTLSLDFTASDIRFQVGIGSTLWTCQLTTGSLTVNTWQHVAVVLDGPVMRLYLDGVQVASTTITSPGALNGSTGGSLPMWGRKNDSTQNYGGYMDLVQVHGSCLYPNGTTFTPAASVLTPPAEFSSLFGVGSSQAPTVAAADGGITIVATLTGTGAAKAGAAGSVGIAGDLFGDTGGAVAGDTGGGKKRKRRGQIDLEREEEEMLEIAALIVPLLGSSAWAR